MSHFAASCVPHYLCVSECVLMSKRAATNSFEAAMLAALVLFFVTHLVLLTAFI